MGPTCALEAFDLNNVPLQFFLKVVSSPADVAEKADRITQISLWAKANLNSERKEMPKVLFED